MSLLTIARSHLQLVANSQLLAIARENLFKLIPIAKSLVANYWIKTSYYGVCLGASTITLAQCYLIYRMWQSGTGHLINFDIEGFASIQFGTNENSIITYILSPTIPGTLILGAVIGSTCGPYIPPMLAYVSYLAWDIYTERSLKVEYKNHMDTIVKSDFIEIAPDSCPICLEDLVEAVKPLSCGHHMHRSCFLKGSQPTCPMCRSLVELTYEEYKAIVNKDADSSQEVEHVQPTITVSETFTTVTETTTTTVVEDRTKKPVTRGYYNQFINRYPVRNTLLFNNIDPDNISNVGLCVF